MSRSRISHHNFSIFIQAAARSILEDSKFNNDFKRFKIVMTTILEDLKFNNFRRLSQQDGQREQAGRAA